MIPLKDDNPTSRPARLTAALVVANVLVFLWELANPQGFEWAVRAYGVVPYEVLTGKDLPPSGLIPPRLTVFSSMFLHGGVAHLAFNMLFLWIFGNNVEDRLGRGRFLFFYLASGVAAAAAQVLVTGPQPHPMVGASGAIAGVLGAYLVLFPQARVLTVVPVFVFLHFVWLPAWVFLLVWFAIQVFSSALGGSVAWYAHIGGFVGGVLLVWLLAPRSPRPRVRVRRYRWS